MKSLMIAFFFVLSAFSTADAQFNKLKNKFGNKVKDKIEQNTTKKAKDKAKEEAGEKAKEPIFDISSMMTGNSDILNGSTYHYDFSIDYLVTSADLKEPMEMTQMFSKENPYFGMIATPEENDLGVEKMTGVIDIEKNYFIMLDEEELRALVFEFENIEDQVAKSVEEDQERNFKITKTSETAMKAGYLCTKYIYTGDDGNGEMWATTQLSYESFDMFSYFKKMNQQHNIKENSVWNSGIEGFILHIKGVDENGKDFEMEALKVNEKANLTYNMDDYGVADMTKMSQGLGNFNNK